MHASLAIVLVSALLGVGAAEDETTRDPPSAVALAKNAFQFRDFESVVRILDPWLHPPKILDKALLTEARQLMGVSLHALGREKGAREEFGQLLLLDPDHQLDPFVIPPNIIATFEAVREEMKDTLAEVSGQKDPPPPDDTPTKVVTVTRIELVEIPPMAAMYLPGGLPQFLLENYGWGVTWLTLQVASLVLNIAANRAAVGLPTDSARFKTFVALQYIGIVSFAAAWGGSSIHGHFQLDALRESLSQRPTVTPPENATLQMRFSW